jgi:hypothetical protein
MSKATKIVIGTVGISATVSVALMLALLLG